MEQKKKEKRARWIGKWKAREWEDKNQIGFVTLSSVFVPESSWKRLMLLPLPSASHTPNTHQHHTIRTTVTLFLSM